MADKPIGKAPRGQNTGYGEAGASYIKRALKGFTATSRSPREDIDANNLTLRQRARVLYMASPIATSAIKTNRTNVIGCGLQMKSRIDRETLRISAEAAEAWQKKAEAEFKLWAGRKENCDALGLCDFNDAQQLAFTASILSGDAFVILKHLEPTPLNPYGLRFHIIEADRVSTPTRFSNATANAIFSNMTEGVAENGNKIYDGIEVDADGKVVAYYIRNTYPFEPIRAGKTEWARVEAIGEKTGLPNILHIMEAERPEQYRGVTYLAQVIEPLLQGRRYTDSELTAAVVESFFTAFIKTEAPADEMPFNETAPEDQSEVSSDPNDYEMGPGQVNVMKPGEDVVFADPKRPAGGFDAFMTSICKQVGAALEIPADLLLKAFNASYSASRAALLEAWKAFKMKRAWFVADFCRPIYEVWLSEAIARGRIYAPGFFSDLTIREAWLGSEWVGPSQGQLDPVKEVTAEKMACEEGFGTREESTIRLSGGSYDANVERLVSENKRLREAQAAEEAAPVEQTENSQLEALAAALVPLILGKIKGGNS